MEGKLACRYYHISEIKTTEGEACAYGIQERRAVVRMKNFPDQLLYLNTWSSVRESYEISKRQSLLQEVDH